MPSKKRINANEPATQHDLSLVSGQLTTRLDRMEKKIDKIDIKIDKLEQGQASLKDSQTAILKVVNSIDIQLKEHKTHPTRIQRLERSVFRH